MAETIKARPRRMKEGFFEKYCVGKGIDIGCGDDPITPDCDRWDKAQGDCTFMDGVQPCTYDWLHSSHCLEHLDDPQKAVKVWWGIVRVGGYISLLLPHRDLYEKRLTLPSRWNGDHRTFWLPDRYEPPCTIGIIPFLVQSLGGRFDLIYCKTCDEGHTITDPTLHSDGEYSIECVIRKT